MIKIYVNLIRAGRRTLDDVPAPLREAVRAALEELEAAEEEKAKYDFTGMTAAEVKRSLSYRPTLDEYRQACDWLGLAWDETMTRAQLSALIDAAVETEGE